MSWQMLLILVILGVSVAFVLVTLMQAVIAYHTPDDYGVDDAQ